MFLKVFSSQPAWWGERKFAEKLITGRGGGGGTGSDEASWGPPPRLVAEGEKNVPLAPSLSKPSGVFLHCTPSSAMAGAQSRSAAVALVATGDGSHVGEDVVQALVEDHVGALVRVSHEICGLSPARLARHLRKLMPLLHEWIVPKLGAEGQHELAAGDVVAKLIH